MARIDVSKPNFHARDDLPPIILPIWQNPPPFTILLQQVPPQVAAVEEEIASSSLSLEEEIDKFHFEEEEGVPERLVQLSDTETDFDRFSVAYPLRLIIAQVTTSSEEEEGMDLKQMTGLKGLLANRNNGSTSKKAPKTQVPPSLPPPPPQLPANLGLKANLNLRKKRPVEDLEEGEVGPQKGAKQQKKTREPKDKRAKSVESQDEAELHQGQRS